MEVSGSASRFGCLNPGKVIRKLIEEEGGWPGELIWTLMLEAEVSFPCRKSKPDSSVVSMSNYVHLRVRFLARGREVSFHRFTDGLQGSSRPLFNINSQQIGRGVKLTTHFHQVLRFKMRGALLLFTYMFSWFDN
jgi:hypothetical protein